MLRREQEFVIFFYKKAQTEKTDLDIALSYTAASAGVFNPDFNNFARITTNQAWSLLFTAGRDDGTLGSNPELRRLFNYILLGIVLAVLLSYLIFRAF